MTETGSRLKADEGTETREHTRATPISQRTAAQFHSAPSTQEPSQPDLSVLSSEDEGVMVGGRPD